MRKVPIPWRMLETSRAFAESAMQRLQRHPVAMQTHFRHSLVVTWAFEPQLLEQFLVPGLKLDTYTDPDGETFAFAAVALVDLDQLRPTGLPRVLSGAHVMTGYRVFCTMQTPAGRTMRGLRILGSQSSSRMSVIGANLTTRYHYRYVRARLAAHDQTIRFLIDSPNKQGDVDITADLADHSLPPDSPFADAKAARRFAGPLPYTFSPDPEGIVVVKSQRTDWSPTPVAVRVDRATFFDYGPFAGAPRRLANAFYLADLDYGWQSGQLFRVGAEADS